MQGLPWASRGRVSRHNGFREAHEYVFGLMYLRNLEMFTVYIWIRCRLAVIRSICGFPEFSHFISQLLDNSSLHRHPLFSPCKCSGSIGLVHQDCLMSWLEVTRKDGKFDGVEFPLMLQSAELTIL